MAGKTKIRAAAVQFGVVADVTANLQTCLRMIDEAVKHKPDVMVLPEFVNHIAWYRDAAHCYEVAVALDDDFIHAIGRKAQEHGCYIKINVTLKRPDLAQGGVPAAEDGGLSRDEVGSFQRDVDLDIAAMLIGFSAYRLDKVIIE